MKNLKWTNSKLAIQMIISYEGDDQELILPLFENLESHDIYRKDHPDLLKAFNVLKKNWEGTKWGYEADVSDMKLIETFADETCMDAEFDVYMFTERAIHSELYDRPFENEPNDMKFCCNFSYDCMIGRVYSKDFDYEHCQDCERTICLQNPSNGWMVQGHQNDAGWECNKCYEERTMPDGINDEFNGSQIPGQFYNDEDIIENGWTKIHDNILVASGYSGYNDPKHAIGMISDLIEAGDKVLVNHEAMAIGGLGGYISIYTK